MSQRILSELAGSPPPMSFRCSVTIPGKGADEAEVLGPSHWSVRSVQLEEQLDAPYTATVTLVTEDALLDVDALVGATFELDVTRGDAVGTLSAVTDGLFSERQFTGVVMRADYQGTHARRMFLRLLVGPALSILGLTRRSRIFQGKTVVEIAQEVVAELFEAYGRELIVDRLSTEPPVVDYCVQYRETDLAFLHRILAEAGISYVWDAGEEGEAMVLLDDNDGFAPLGLGAAEPPESEAPTLVEILTSDASRSSGLSQFGWTRRIATASHEASAWDWKATPATRLSSTVSPDEPTASEWGEHYLHQTRRIVEDGDGAGSLVDSTAAQALRAAQRAANAGGEARGRGNMLAMTAGATFEVDGHPNPHLMREYVTTRVVHRAEIPAADVHDSSEGARYDNELEALPLDLPYRPKALPKPRIEGPQLGTVVGPTGEEIHTDAHGRIKVWLHWDREGEAAQTHDVTCWIPVAQAWAGPGYGTFFVPRVGMEVVVMFIEGDPDRPLVTGCVHTVAQPPPVDLPDAKTQSVIRTSSSPGGGGFNELRFEDAAEREEIYIHAQRNLRERVRSCHTMSVGASSSVTIGTKHTRSVGEGELVYVGEGSTPEPSASAPPSSREVHVDGDQAQVIKELHSIEAKSAWWKMEETLNAAGGQTVWISRGPAPAADTRPPPPLMEMVEQDIKLEAGNRIELAVGGTKIVLTAGGIELVAASVTIAAGASVMKLDDDGTTLEAVEIETTAGGNSMLRLRDGEAKIETGLAEIIAGGAVEIAASDTCKLLGTDIEAKATTSMKLAGASVAVDGSKVDVVSSGPHVIQGKPVKIN